MSKTQKRHPPSAKNVKNRVVTIMVSFPKNVEKICDDNFLHIFQNNLGVFFVIQI
jgi:hypothetical protein